MSDHAMAIDFTYMNFVFMPFSKFPDGLLNHRSYYDGWIHDSRFPSDTTY